VKLYDTFLYSGMGTEPDLLECRLRELDGLVDWHVIVEGALTFQGDVKPLTFDELDARRFAPWRDRIMYVPHYPTTVEPGKEPGLAWAREHSSRQAALFGARSAGAVDGDVILHGDVDEIPTRAAVTSLRAREDEIVPCKLSLRFFMFAVDWEVPWRWNAPSVMRVGQLENMTQLRETGWGTWPHGQAPDGSHGWHLTWLGGRQAAVEKVHAFSHVEAIPETMTGLGAGKYYRDGVWWPGSGRPHETQFTPVTVDRTWPQWIADSWDAEAKSPRGPAPDVWFRPRGLRAG
jgi:beta-1,4-mannosyl-glycoprotein beta-1,4-N-acetylglucosaminyltransferase